MAQYDENTIFCREKPQISDVTVLLDLIDELFRVGKYANKANNFLNRNVVVLFEFLNDENIRGLSSGYMSKEQSDREKYALSVKQACKKYITDPLVMRRVRHGYLEYIDEDSVYFSDKRIDDIVKIGRTLKDVEVFTPLCIVAHIDDKTELPHCHVLYITHNVRTSLYNVLDAFNNDKPEEESSDEIFL
jgi:hypothetical protein